MHDYLDIWVKISNFKNFSVHIAKFYVDQSAENLSKVRICRFAGSFLN